ncbi:SAM-dependent methyltransferase [Bradyrhizobium sp. GM2.4]
MYNTVAATPAPQGWLNFDSSPTARLEKIPILGRLVHKNACRFPKNVLVGDVVRGLPVPDNSADGVYASHVLEHLCRSDFEIALGNTFRILKAGGIFRLIVPDLEARAREYISRLNSGTADSNDWFMKATHLGTSERPVSLVQKSVRMFGGSLHLWMWDFPSMKLALQRAGFAHVRRCSLGDSRDQMFTLVEDPRRFHDSQDGITELAVEARKP